VTTIKAYLFDLDGTLVDSEPLKGLALADTCRAYGGAIEAADYIAVMGEEWSKVLNHFFKKAGIDPAPDEFTIQFRKRYRELIEERVTLIPGAADFIAQAKKQGLKTGVVSSAAAWMVEKVLTKFNLQKTFDVVITEEMVAKHKPDPEAYVLALARLKLKPEEALIFEDSAAGLKAATAAGCRSIFIRHEYNLQHDASTAEKVISNFSELK